MHESPPMYLTTHDHGKYTYSYDGMKTVGYSRFSECETLKLTAWKARNFLICCALQASIIIDKLSILTQKIDYFYMDKYLLLTAINKDNILCTSKEDCGRLMLRCVGCLAFSTHVCSRRVYSCCQNVQALPLLSEESLGTRLDQQLDLVLQQSIISLENAQATAM